MGVSATGPWHALAADAAVARLGSDAARGLTDAAAVEHRARSGPNDVPGGREEPWWKEALEPLAEPLVLLLVAVGALYAIFGEWRDALTIFVVIVAVAAVESLNETRARRAVTALARLAAPEATVVRAGTMTLLPARDLVPGDVVLLDAGRRVPADLRLLTTEALRVDESALTGESQPVSKRAEAVLTPDAPVADRANLAFAGTTVTAGRGRGLVVATGRGTEMGRVAGLAAAARPARTPLQAQMAGLARSLLWLAVALSVLIPALDVLIGGRPWRFALLEGLTLAFATIPEELPILITIVLAIGARRLAGEHAITRHLRAAETLGSVTVIGTDKTGTLTENRMRVVEIVVDGVRTPMGSAPPGDTARRLLFIGALANDARVNAGGAAAPAAIGDPTDLAVLAAAEEAGVLPGRDAARIVERRPFDDVRQRVAVVYEAGGALGLAVKGAPERVVALSERVLVRGREMPLDPETRRGLMRQVEEIASTGARVIACAERRLGPERPAPGADVEAGLTLVGLAGLEDPPRPEVAPAIRSLHEAGVRIVMLTGDHPRTARAIAGRVGIEPGRVVTGQELEQLGREELGSVVSGAVVFARITPEHKLRIVEALERRGEVVGVTGDGVNDAPALRRAAIGIAMGRRGTDVARESAGLVLSDDNFATVAGAVRAGRVLYENLRKAVRYYLAAKVALITASLAAVVAGLPLPFVPVQIIVLELFMDLGASTTFVVEPAEEDVMRRPPRDPRRRFMDRAMLAGVLAGGLSLAAAVLAAYGWALGAGLARDASQTAAFVAWMIGHVVLAAHMRSAREPLLRRGLRLTWPFALWVGAVLALLVAAVLFPVLARRLHLAPLPPAVLAVAIGSALVLPSWWEVAKWRRWTGRQ